jgi:hypothetical protein
LVLLETSLPSIEEVESTAVLSFVCPNCGIDIKDENGLAARELDEVAPLPLLQSDLGFPVLCLALMAVLATVHEVMPWFIPAYGLVVGGIAVEKTFKEGANAVGANAKVDASF